MKKLFLLPLLLLTLYASAQIDKYVPKRPSPPKLVNDLTNTLTPEQTHALESKLVAYDDSTSNQIAIVIIPTTGDYPIEDVAIQILRQWGVGNAKNNNGIVLLIAKDDRKIRMEMGYGLEGAIPDMVAASIIDYSITPRFKGNDYYGGLDAGTTEIIKAAAGEYKAPEGYNSKKGKGKGIGFGAIIFGIIMIFLFIGGGGGGRSGGMVSRRGFRDFGTGWIIGSLLGGGGSGGGWGGGGSSGGGGGGFGGFGGGSGGGGGASGSW